MIRRSDQITNGPMRGESMRNKTISFISLFLISIACAGTAVQAAPAAAEKAPEAIQSANQPTSDAEAAAKQQLEQELRDTSLADKTAVDFPNRPSLGTLELAPLPGINEVGINGPAPMAQSVSKKDLPSEQLLGRITPEVFQEMADLERGNTFLKLQMQKEQLKNDLEKLKATYRQNRLDEISKREEVVRSRIQWWQEQEKVRLEIEKKEAEEAELEKQIAEQEALRDKLREEAIKKAEAGSGAEGSVKTAIALEATQTSPIFMDMYALMGVRGIQGKLVARLKNLSDDSIITVKQDDILPSGHVVKNITKDTVSVVYGNRQDQLSLQGQVVKPQVNNQKADNQKSGSK